MDSKHTSDDKPAAKSESVPSPGPRPPELNADQGLAAENERLKGELAEYKAKAGEGPPPAPPIEFPQMLYKAAKLENGDLIIDRTMVANTNDERDELAKSGFVPSQDEAFNQAEKAPDPPRSGTARRAS